MTDSIPPPIVDRSAHGWNGNLQGSATFAPPSGGALSLDGQDNGVVIPLGSESAFDIGDSDFTLYARFSTTLFDDSETLFRALIWKQAIGANPAYLLGVQQATGDVSFRISDGSTHVVVMSTMPLNDGAYHEVFGVRQGTSIHLYVDGVLDASTPIPLGFGSTNNNESLVIGGRTISSGGVHDEFSGLIDEVRVYNVAVPEPGACLLALIGFGGLAVIARSRRHFLN